MVSTGKLYDFKDGMKMPQIMNAIHGLAQAQGFYGRLERDILDAKKNDPARYKAQKDYLEGQKYKSRLDMVMDLEG